MKKPVKVWVLMLVTGLVSVAPDSRETGYDPSGVLPSDFLSVAQAEDGAGTTLEQLLTALQAHPDDRRLRQRIIERVRALRPPPPMPPEARRQFVMGNTAVQEAKTPEDIDAAIRHYEAALRVAPWWADAYYNLALALVQRTQYAAAIETIQFYQLANPADEKAQDLLYVLEAKREAQTREAARLMGAREQAGRDGAPMVLVPAGEFLYGDSNQRLSLPAFSMDQFEVSTRRYSQFLQATSRKQPDDWSQQVALVGNGDRPVVNVTWHDADAYCRHYGKRLPTEQEWEKAARGTDGRRYPWGNEGLSSRHASFYTQWINYETLATVESHEAGKSPYGLYQMAGNVWEWTSSDYNSLAKVVRGGSWGSLANDLRTTTRHALIPSIGINDLGFRCAQDAK